MALKKLSVVVAAAFATGALALGGTALAYTAVGSPAPGAVARPAGTEVTGDELAKVTAAVKAKDSAVEVAGARKAPDGSYRVFGTKAGNRVMFEVSADLKTVTEGVGRGGGRGPGGPIGTEVTGDELAKVTAAVKSKDAAVEVKGVRKDAAGAYYVLGTKAGNRVMFEVSADLKTITEAAGRGPGGGPGGGPGHTEVTGDELAKVTAAVKAKDASVEVVGVHKDADGSYDVFGTKAGNRVMFEVSADLKTITERAPGTRPGRGHGPTK